MSHHNHKAPVAVVLGAASDIGFELSKQCLLQGKHVVMADSEVTELCHKVEQLSGLTEQSVLGIVCDMTHLDQVRQLVKQTYAHFGQVDWLFIHHPISIHQGALWELTPEHMSNVLNGNVIGIMQCIQTFMPFLSKQSCRSHIINMASAYGVCNGSHLSAYTIPHHAVVALSESLYLDIRRAQKPIDVSVVCHSLSLRSIPHVKPQALFTQHLQHMLYETTLKNQALSDLVSQIMRGIYDKTFYIAPDRQVINYCHMRAEAIQDGLPPYEYRLPRKRQGQALSWDESDSMHIEYPKIRV